MATLKDGRFVFIHADRQHLLIEHPSSESGEAAAKSATVAPLATQLLYGGVVHAFALNTAQTRIAMVCPTGSAAAPITTSATAVGCVENLDAPQTVLRLFSFSNGEVGELLDELVTVMVRAVVWVGERFLALEARRGRDVPLTTAHAFTPAVSPGASPVASVSTIVVEVAKSPQRLRLVREEKKSASPAAGPASLLCDLSHAKQSLRLWDLSRGKMTAECQLPNRKCRHGKTRTAVSTSSDGPFVFVANDDWTVHGFYVGRNGSVHTPKPMLTQFESQSASQATQMTTVSSSSNAEVSAREAKEEEEEEATAVGSANSIAPVSPSPPVRHGGGAGTLPPPRLYVRMLSDTQVLVTLCGSATILQCAYHPKAKGEEEWTVMAKMRLPRRLHATAEVVGLAKKKCLVRQRDPGDGDAEECQGGSAYVVLPLEMKSTTKVALGEAVAEAAAGEKAGEEAVAANGVAGSEAGDNDTATEGKRKRRRKKKKNGGEADDADAKTEDASRIGVPPPSAPSTAKASTASTTRDGSRSAGGPTQRAVQRLLVHAGIIAKEEVPHAFTRGGDGNGGVVNTAHEDAHEAAAAATNGGAPQNAAAPGESWLSTDAVMAAGGAVLGVVVGIYILRRLSLL